MHGLNKKTINIILKMSEWIEGMQMPLEKIFRIFDADDSGEISRAEFYDVIETVHKGVTFEEK